MQVSFGDITYTYAHCLCAPKTCIPVLSSLHPACLPHLCEQSLDYSQLQNLLLPDVFLAPCPAIATREGHVAAVLRALLSPAILSAAYPVHRLSGKDHVSAYKGIRRFGKDYVNAL